VIMDMAPPTDQTGVKSFMGPLNFNRGYVPRFNDFTDPTKDLLCKETNGELIDVVKLLKDDLHGEEFRLCKAALTSAQCLMTIDSAKSFTLHVDSCKNGRGPGAALLQQNDNGDWILQQNDKGDWKPVSYFSCRLWKGEHSWSATESEAKGLVQS
jgi:hypothetical protein